MTLKQKTALIMAAFLIVSLSASVCFSAHRSLAETAAPSPAPATPAPGTAEAQAAFYALMSARTGLDCPREYPDNFAGSYIGEEDGLLHIDLVGSDAAELEYYKQGLGEYTDLVVFGTAAFSRNALTAQLDAILAELLKAGIHYSSYTVHAPTNSIRIVVPHEELSAAEKILPQLDCVKAKPDIPVFLSDGSFEGVGAVSEEPKGSGFPILAVLLTLSGVGVFFLRRRAQKRRIMRMGF